MSKANIVEKKTVSIKAILDVNEADNDINIELEDGEVRTLASILKNFNGEEVSISVAQTNEIA